jgi:hypothetical protein
MISPTPISVKSQLQTLSFDPDRSGRRQLLPDKCHFKTGIGAFWRFQLGLFPSREGKPVGLGNLRSIR